MEQFDVIGRPPMFSGKVQSLNEDVDMVPEGDEGAIEDPNHPDDDQSEDEWDQIVNPYPEFDGVVNFGDPDGGLPGGDLVPYNPPGGGSNGNDGGRKHGVKRPREDEYDLVEEMEDALDQMTGGVFDFGPPSPKRLRGGYDALGLGDPTLSVPTNSPVTPAVPTVPEDPMEGTYKGLEEFWATLVLGLPLLLF